MTCFSQAVQELDETFLWEHGLDRARGFLEAFERVSLLGSFRKSQVTAWARWVVEALALLLCVIS